jgi:hypothetical protein
MERLDRCAATRAMKAGRRETTTYEWVRSYTALSRSGCLTDEIRACEIAWGAQTLGNPSAAEAVQKARGYPAYARELRRLLKFPLTVYRVATAQAFEAWESGALRRPIAVTLCPDLLHLVRDAYYSPTQDVVLLKGVVSDPDAVIMRGRLEGYELVIDSGRVKPVEVTVMHDHA